MNIKKKYVDYRVLILKWDPLIDSTNLTIHVYF
jgi:hypothetical protein